MKRFLRRNGVGYAAALLVVMLAVLSPDAPAPTAADAGTPIRIGFFPNVTHAQALYAKRTGAFEQALAAPVTWIAFNAGPSAIEALFSDELDASYVGPNPAINGYIKSRGEKFVVVSGSALGGAGLVIRPGAGISSEKDFDGRKIATPQLGNTQDVAARKWFKQHGYTLSEKGGTLTLIPIANADQINLFKKGELDGSWSVEPWLSRLEDEAGARLFLDEANLWPDKKYVTTLLIMSKRFLEHHPDQAAKLIQAHLEVTEKINSDKTAAAVLINEQLKTELGSPLSGKVMQSAIERVTFTWDPAPAELTAAADAAFEVGLVKEKPVLTGIFKLDLLNSALRAANLQPIDAAGVK